MERTRLRHELVQLSTLVVIAIGVFFGTREIAAYSQRVHARDAAAWYQQGVTALRSGDAARAADDFRRAAAKNREERTYALALASALRRAGNLDASERALLALREGAPEDADVNFELAQIAASRDDVTAAVRYYRNALYAPASAADPDRRRRVRLQLIQLLLDHDDTARALGELLVAAEDTSADAAAATRLGELFARAGDYQRAEDQFARALRLDPRNVEARIGAGTAAFTRGEYAAARRLLRGAPVEQAEARVIAEIAGFVIDDDPLAPRITSAERRRRLMSGIDAARRRAGDCMMRGLANGRVQDLAKQLDAFAANAKRLDLDAIDEGVALVHDSEQASDESCGGGTSLDRALVLIGRLHGVEPR